MIENLEELKRVEDHALNPLQPSTLQRRIKRRINYLNENGGNLLVIAHLQQSFDLLSNHLYRTRIKEIKDTMRSYSK